MTEKLTDMGSSMGRAVEECSDPASVERAAIAGLVRAARDRGDDVTGQHGLLGQLTATVLETALDGELDEHPGYGLQPDRRVQHRLADEVPPRCRGPEKRGSAPR